MWVLDSKIIRILRDRGFPTGRRLQGIMEDKMREAHPDGEWALAYQWLYPRNEPVPADIKAIAATTWGLCSECEGLIEEEGGYHADWIREPDGQMRTFCSPLCAEVVMKRLISEQYGPKMWDRIEADLDYYRMTRWAYVERRIEEILKFQKRST